MALRATQAAAQYLVIGDSFAGTFDGIVLQGDGGPIAVTARWQPGMRCRELLSDGRPFACVPETLSRDSGA